MYTKYIDELLTAREQRRSEPVTEDELPEDSQVLENESDGAVYLEYRTCGDESCSCMSGGTKHGPYKYRAYRDGDTVRREYLGKATETGTEALLKSFATDIRKTCSTCHSRSNQWKVATIQNRKT